MVKCDGQVTLRYCCCMHSPTFTLLYAGHAVHADHAVHAVHAVHADQAVHAGHAVHAERLLFINVSFLIAVTALQNAVRCYARRNGTEERRRTVRCGSQVRRSGVTVGFGGEVYR